MLPRCRGRLAALAARNRSVDLLLVGARLARGIHGAALRANLFSFLDFFWRDCHFLLLIWLALDTEATRFRDHQETKVRGR